MSTTRIASSPAHISKSLVMKFENEEAANSLPSVQLARMLREAHAPRNNYRGVPVLLNSFEVSLSATEFPDRLLTVLSKNMPTFSFDMHESDEKRWESERKIMKAICTRWPSCHMQYFEMG